MCKAIDECLAASPQGATAEPLLKKKRVRFRAASIFEFDKIVEEKPQVWYNRHEYDQIKAGIGKDALAKSRGADETIGYCFRGLEFLKLDDSLPSRKERRQAHVKHVLLYQRAASKAAEKEATELLEAFCSQISAEATQMSAEATQRALALASMDASEARQVYQECHLLYQVNGQDRAMFGRSSSLCREQVPSSSSDYILHNPLQDVFSYKGLSRLATLFTTSVN